MALSRLLGLPLQSERTLSSTASCRDHSVCQRPSGATSRRARWTIRTLVLELVSALAAELIPRLNRRRLVPGGFTHHYRGIRRHSRRSGSRARETPIKHFLARPVADDYYIKRNVRLDVE